MATPVPASGAATPVTSPTVGGAAGGPLSPATQQRQAVTLSGSALLALVADAKATWQARPKPEAADAATYEHEPGVAAACHLAAQRLLVAALSTVDQRNAIISRWVAHNLINHAEAARTGARHCMRDTEYREYLPDSVPVSPIAITVNIIAARGLPNSAISYCTARVGSMSHGWTTAKTPSINKQAAPTWNFSFSTQSTTAALPTSLTVDVWDDVTGADTLLGSVRIDLMALYRGPHSTISEWYPLQLGSCNAAQLQLSLVISPVPCYGVTAHEPWLDAVRDCHLPAEATPTFTVQATNAPDTLECKLQYTWQVQRRFQAFRDLHEALPKLDVRGRLQAQIAADIAKEAEPVPDTPGLTDQIRDAMKDTGPKSYERYDQQYDGLFPLPSTVTGTANQRRCALLNELMDMVMFQLNDTGPSTAEWDVRHGVFDLFAATAFPSPNKQIRLPVHTAAHTAPKRPDRPELPHGTPWSPTDRLPAGTRVPPLTVGFIGASMLTKVAPFFGFQDLTSVAESKLDLLDICSEFGAHTSRRFDAVVTGFEEIGSKFSLSRHTEYKMQVSFQVSWRVARPIAIAQGLLGSPAGTWDPIIQQLNDAGLACFNDPRHLILINPHFFLPDMQRYEHVLRHLKRRYAPETDVEEVKLELTAAPSGPVTIGLPPQRPAPEATPVAVAAPVAVAPPAAAAPAMQAAAGVPQPAHAAAGPVPAPGPVFTPPTPASPVVPAHAADTAPLLFLPSTPLDSANMREFGQNIGSPTASLAPPPRTPVRAPTPVPAPAHAHTAAAAPPPRRSMISQFCHAVYDCLFGAPQQVLDDGVEVAVRMMAPARLAAALPWVPPPPKYLQDTYPSTAQISVLMDKLVTATTTNSVSFGLFTAWSKSVVATLLLKPEKHAIYENVIKAGMAKSLEQNSSQLKRLTLDAFRLPSDDAAQPDIKYLGYDLERGFHASISWKLAFLHAKVSGEGEATVTFSGSVSFGNPQVAGHFFLQPAVPQHDWSQLPEVVQLSFDGVPDVSYALSISASVGIPLPLPVSIVGGAIARSKLYLAIRKAAVYPNRVSLPIGDVAGLDRAIQEQLRQVV